MTEIQNPKQKNNRFASGPYGLRPGGNRFGIWNLRFVWNLMLEIWDLFVIWYLEFVI